MIVFEFVAAIYALKIIGYFLLRLYRKKGALSEGIRERVGPMPSVDIILPMYNEGKIVVNTILNLLAINYKDFQIIVVDDGSTDNSYDVVKRHFSGHPLVKLIPQEPNAGKSAALNRGMKASDNEIIVTIDADTWVRPDAISHLAAYFSEPGVGAVAGHIKVGNRTNILADMQYFEYVAIWDHDRAFSDWINGILVVPGALGAFRRSAVEEVGGFKSDVIAEDTELTLRLSYHHFTIRNAAEAVAYTEAPENLKMFFRQRVRWTMGLSQGLVKHHKKLIRHSNRWIPFLILPYTWAFRVILPSILPLVDYYFIYVYFFLRHYESLYWWGGLILMDAFTNAYLLRMSGEKVGFFRIIILQRLYRHLLFLNYRAILIKWLKGTLFSWEKITRKGNIRLNSEILPFKRKPESEKST